MNTNSMFQKMVTELFNPLYKLAAAIAFVYFLYGVVLFIYNYNKPDEKNTGKSHLLWGLVGLFIIFSIGGIMKVFSSLFGNLFSF